MRLHSLNNNNYKRNLLASALSVAVVSSPYAIANEVESFALEEIIVTAQKRAQSLQDVPISVSAMGGDKMSEAGIESLSDLSAYVPNLRVIDGGLTPQLFIRGIGSGSNQGFEQSVGIYTDGVYAGRSLQSRAGFMDLERVEVLRGPQSILFGQSSIAGAVSLISAKPTDEFEGMVSLGHVPEFDETEVNAYISGPLTDSVRARLALRERQEGGFVDNKLRNEDAPELDEQAARLTLDWAVGDLLATFKAEVSSMERQGRPMTAIDLGDYPTLTAIGTHGPLQQSSTRIAHDMWTDADNKLEFDNHSFVLNLEYGLGEHTLTSITAYSEYEYKEDNYDGEGSEVNLVSLDMTEDFDQLSQELRLTSPGGETIDYIVGLFYQTSEQDYREDATLTVSSIGLDVISGLPVGLLDSYSNRVFTQESETYAAFGQLTWNVSDLLRLNMGLRYTRDEKEGSRDQETFSLSAAPGVSLNDIAVPVYGNVATIVASEFNMADHNLKDKYDEENWTPSINLQYDLSGDVMLYASYSAGYKAAGYDARGINGWTSTTAFPGKSGVQLGGESFFFDQEEAETIELGAKMTLLDGSAELNIAVYQTDYTDMQVSVFDGTFGYSVQNAGEARVRGLELDGRWRATENLTLSGSLGYLDFEWLDYTAGACNGMGTLPVSPVSADNCDYTGKENQHTPEWTANLSADYIAYLGDGLELRSTLDANFKDNHYAFADLDPRSELSAMTVFNGRIALAASDDSWQLAITGKNLTDRDMFSYGSPVTQSNGGFFVKMMRPRTLGIEGLYRF